MNLRDVHPADCPGFTYDAHPSCNATLPGRVAAILQELRRGQLDTVSAAADTRAVHNSLFDNLTPPECPYYAGHYRGEDYRCLRNCNVGLIRPDGSQVPGVGWPPNMVGGAMRELARAVRSALAGLDQGHKVPNAQIPVGEKILRTVQVACSIFDQIGRIHPYANGNGHAARFCIWAILGRYGYWPARWPIHPRPPEPAYSDLIAEYQKGNRMPLERYVLQCLKN